MNVSEHIAKLESLLARIQRRAAEPRAPRAPRFAHPVSAEPTPPFTPVLHVPMAMPDPLAHAVVAAEPAPVEIDVPIAEPTPAPVQELAEVALDLEPSVPVPPVEEPVEQEPTSGEFAVAAEPLMELEELGPASEYDDDPVVEIQLEPPAPPVENLAPALEEAPAHDDEYHPPESGRELVASPHESQRVAVAAPSVPEEVSLELHEHELPPPESSRNLRAAPALEPELPPKLQTPLPEAPVLEDEQPTQQFKVAVPAELELDRAEHVVEAAPEPHLVEAGPPSEPLDLDRAEHVVEAAPEPHPVEESFEAELPLETAPVVEEPQPAVEEPPPAVEEPAPVIEALAPLVEEPPPAAEAPAVVVAAPLEAPPIVEAALEAAAPAEMPVADVIRPQIVAADVAAYIAAARAPRPETFGVLFDAALDL